jgi:hypothetical protein|tara:strand:- start:182 stop:547 length:366 start_codon:yes stop_codon:yes gene_type:complete
MLIQVQVNGNINNTVRLSNSYDGDLLLTSCEIIMDPVTATNDTPVVHLPFLENWSVNNAGKGIVVPQTANLRYHLKGPILFKNIHVPEQFTVRINKQEDGTVFNSLSSDFERLVITFQTLG